MSSLTVNDEQRKQFETESQEIIQDTLTLTGFHLRQDDPTVIHLILQRRWLEKFYHQVSQIDEDNAQGIFNALSPLIADMKNTVELISEKQQELKQDISTIKSLKKEFLSAVVSRNEKLAQENVKNEIKNQVSDSLKALENEVSGSLNTMKLKNNLMLLGVFALQFITVLIVVLMAFKVFK